MTGAELHDLRLALDVLLIDLARELGVTYQSCGDAETSKRLRPSTASRYTGGLLRVAKRQAEDRRRRSTAELVALASAD
jgi:hypothetical protein